MWRRDSSFTSHDNRIGLAARREILTESEGELGFADAHVVRSERDRSATCVDPLREQPARQRPVDSNVPLAGLAGRGDLPTEGQLLRQSSSLGLDRVALVDLSRPALGRKLREALPALPAFP